MVSHSQGNTVKWLTLQDTATHCNTLKHAATHTATHSNTLQHRVTRYRKAGWRYQWQLSGQGQRPRGLPLSTFSSEVNDTATHCNTLQNTATHSNTHGNTHCNTLQHITTHRPSQVKWLTHWVLSSKHPERVQMLGCNNGIGGFHQNLVTFRDSMLPIVLLALKMRPKQCSS